MWLMIVMALALTAGMQTVSAEDTPMTPVMFSLFNPAQVPAENYDVNGLRIDVLYGKCRNLTGLDAGVLVNHATGKVIGLEACFVVNYVEKSFTGLQVGTVNVAKEIHALQVGVYNEADDATGIQIGVINHARIMRGIQIGVINVIDNNDIPFLPVINFFF
jgi:hypothetical protein